MKGFDAKWCDLPDYILGITKAIWEDRACHLELPGGVTGHGHAAGDRFWMRLWWSLHGRHDGWGTFGRPTGASVYAMGITHAEFGPWRLRREHTLIDETAIWKQILLQTG